MKGPVCDRIAGARCQLGGFVGDYLKGITEQWLLVAPRANPAMLEMFRDRDSAPLRDMVPWAGEFAGKYLTGAVQVLRLTGDPHLRKWLMGANRAAKRFDRSPAMGTLLPQPNQPYLRTVIWEGRADSAFAATGDWDISARFGDANGRDHHNSKSQVGSIAC